MRAKVFVLMILFDIALSFPVPLSEWNVPSPNMNDLGRCWNEEQKWTITITAGAKVENVGGI